MLAAALPLAAAALQCPESLGPLCEGGSGMSKCIEEHCKAEMAACLKDKGCIASGLLTCSLFHKNASIAGVPCCFVQDPPDPQMSDLFNCILEKGRCMSPGPAPKYPACQDSTVKGDPAFSMASLQGTWHKVHSWRKGEEVECLPCQNATFSAPSSSEHVSFASWFSAPDCSGKKYMPTGPVVADMSPDAARGAGKLFNTGIMYSLTYWEPYTVVHDGSREKDPFVLFYVCGGTIQGNYTTAFAVASTPTVSAATSKRIQSIVEDKLGQDWADWCTVDNSCMS
eukprot:TRINITY_DN6947_c0_g1_i1.p1 TRINITY_DN6947_c0_g1~~TRINITY_DN6947_c0_g1_i1.p1  ORF type:complete len:307 (+),score=104.60 TRINITY_DN6947_c0_g1_i1:75-923(+)